MSRGKTRLQMLREDKHLSKAELARRAGMQQGIIGWVESGRFKPYESQLQKLACALNWQGEPRELMEEVD